MSVLMEFAIFPTDKGESVSAYVARVLEQVRASGHPYQLTAMGTIVETATMEEATTLLNQAYVLLAVYAVYMLEQPPVTARHVGWSQMFFGWLVAILTAVGITMGW